MKRKLLFSPERDFAIGGWLLVAAVALCATQPVAFAQDPLAESLGLTRDTRSLPLWTKPNPDLVDDLSQQVRVINPSVMIVGSADGGYGTAFVISKEHRLLATNAHVADIRHASGQMLAIPSGTSQVFEIDRVYYHPGVVRNGSGNVQFRSTNPSDGKVAINSPDIAVLHVAGDDALPEALPLASPEEVEDLFAKTVGMLGFPGHDTVSWPGLGKKAQATYRQGVIARATDFFNDANADSRDRQHLQHTMQSWGGFSGSPIFLVNGRVAALHNAGATIQSNEGRAASLQFGVRIDCLWELLAHHKLTEQLAVPVPIDDLRLGRFDGEDPRLMELRKVKDLLAEADILRAEHKFAEAGELYNEAIKRMPNYAPAHEKKGFNHTDYQVIALGRTTNRTTPRYQQSLDQTRFALKHSRVALRLDPTNPWYLLSHANAQGNLNRLLMAENTPLDLPEMREVASRVIERAGTDPDLLSYAYRIYANSFPYAHQAIPWYTKAVEACPWRHIALEDRAFRYELLGRHSLAAADRRKSKDIQEAELARLKAGRLISSTDESVHNPVEAILLAEEACRLFDYKYWGALHTLAVAHSKAGNHDQAIHWITEAQKIAPEPEKSFLARHLRNFRDKAAALQKTD
jgi:tetratricopeptide (TPR) repeat protein